MGHEAARCPTASKAWKNVRAEGKAAFEERQRRRAERVEAAKRHEEWLASHPCWRCGMHGHTRDKCPLLPRTAKMDTDACSDVSTDPSLVAAAPPSIASASTASTVADRPLSKNAPVT